MQCSHCAKGSALRWPALTQRATSLPLSPLYCTVLYLTFVSFVLFAAACASTDWILGGLEFGDQSVPNSQAHFHVSLTSVQVEAYIIDPYLSSGNVNNPVTYNNVNSALQGCPLFSCACSPRAHELSSPPQHTQHP